jgi:hypothetical protein
MRTNRTYTPAIILALFALALPAVAQVVYVDQNAPGPAHDGTAWDTALLTIQGGVGAAAPGYEVWVADGVYIENVTLTAGVALYGGFLGAEDAGYEQSLQDRRFAANPTVIDGNLSGACVAMAEGSRVDGFTLTNGIGVLVGEDTYGGGIYSGDAGGTIVIANNTVVANSAVYGGGICCRNSSPLVEGNTVCGNSVTGDGGGMYISQSDALVTRNIVTANLSDYHGGGVHFCDYSTATFACNIVASNDARSGGGLSACANSSPNILNNTVSANDVTAGGGGIYISFASPTVTNNIVCYNSAYNAGGGIWSWFSSPVLSHNDLWDNYATDYEGCEPGEGDISVDPRFAGIEVGDFHLKADSLCIDAGDSEAAGSIEFDWESEARIADDIVDIGADEFVTYAATAPDPQPECSGPLFGGSQTGFPAWVWFSIPMTPEASADPNDVLGFENNGRLYKYDKYLKAPIVYQPPFSEWDLSVGDSYIVWLAGAVANPSYQGLSPFVPWSVEYKLGRQGWTWVGMPGLTQLGASDFMQSVIVRYPSDESGVCRTARQDYAATPDNWIAWGWPYWNTWLQAVETFTPYAPFGHKTCYPWVGYRVWVKVGTATTDDDPDQVTICWPKSQ